MPFNSLAFAVFFAVTTAVYFALPHRARWAWLLCTSAAFYMAAVPVHLLLLLGLTGLGYATGLLMETAKSRFWRRRWLELSVVGNLGVLGVFKYLGFFNENVARLADLIGWNYSLQTLSLLLPIALSFVTFQILSYSFEVYAGRLKAERHVGHFALYVLFFPKLLAGPIERPQSLLPQFRERMEFDYARVTSGLRLIAWGLFKKVVVADRLAIIVAPVFDNPEVGSGPVFLLAALFYTFQIYYDFSGYTDMARGTARILGFRLMDNFNFPNFATSIGDFWRRWHISLSSWFRDYIYFPMGGSRLGYVRQCVNLMTVFLVTGLWHGANWTFVVWGAFHGVLITLQMTHKRLPTRFQIRLPEGLLGTLIAITVTFTLVMLGRIAFRANDLGDAWTILSGLGTGWSATLLTPEGVNAQLWTYSLSRVGVLVGLVCILLVEFIHLLQAQGEKLSPRLARLLAVPRWPLVPRWTMYIVVTWMVLLGYAENPDAFIYFRF